LTLSSCYNYSNYLHTLLAPTLKQIKGTDNICSSCHLYNTDCHLTNEYTSLTCYLYSPNNKTDSFSAGDHVLIFCIEKENLYH
jgi:hypothetical protein